MKPTWLELTEEQKHSFGNGCSNVPDFIFTANCRQHDYNYVRGHKLKDKIKADWDMCKHMWSDSQTMLHYIVTIIYWLGLTVLPFSYFAFNWANRYLTNDEILVLDNANKINIDTN